MTTIAPLKMQTPQECLRLYSPASRDGGDQKENNSVVWRTLEGGVTVAGALQILLWQAKIYENNGERSKADKIRLHVADFLSDVSEPRKNTQKRRCLKCNRVRVPMPCGKTICEICDPPSAGKPPPAAPLALSSLTHEEFDQIA